MDRILVIRSSAWEEEIMFPLKTSFCDWGFRVLISGSSHTVQKKAVWDKAFVQSNEVGEKVMCGETTCLVFKKVVSHGGLQSEKCCRKVTPGSDRCHCHKVPSAVGQLRGGLFVGRPGCQTGKATAWQPAATELFNCSSVVGVTGEALVPRDWNRAFIFRRYLDNTRNSYWPQGKERQ